MRSRGGLTRLLAVLGMITMGLLVSGSLTPRVTLAEDPPSGHQAQCEMYSDIFLNNLATQLDVSKEQLGTNLKQAATQTIDQAVANGDLGFRKADRLKERIQQGDLCVHGRGMHGGMGGMHGGMGGMHDGMGGGDYQYRGEKDQDGSSTPNR